MTFDRDFPERVRHVATTGNYGSIPLFKCKVCGTELKNEAKLLTKTFVKRARELDWQVIRKYDKNRFSCNRMSMGTPFYKWEIRCPVHNLLKVPVCG